ncbi:MAG: hypothetical protein K9H65_00510 [Bacteroidales bacterium]|nr:hypothetical protein [Bacteroidales bacterium]
MKKILFFVILIIFSFSAFAQHEAPTVQELNEFFDTETYIVLDPNPTSTYNIKLKEAVKTNWHIGDYEFIERNEFEEKKNNPDNFFLISNLVVFERDKTKVRYRFLSLLKGDGEDDLKEMPSLCAFPLSYRKVDEESWVYKMDVIIRFMQNHVKNMKENPDIVDEDLDYYNKNLEDIKDKTLYLIEDELAEDVNTREKIKEYYPYDFKLVTRGEVKQAIKDEREKVVFLHKVGPQGSRYRERCYKILMGAKDAKIYYFDYHIIKKGRRPDGFLKRDFRRIKRKAGGGLFGL